MLLVIIRIAHNIWAVPCENVSSGIRRQLRSRSACAFAQSDQGYHCPLTESLHTTEYMNGEQKPGWYSVHTQDDLNLYICACLKALCIFKGTCALVAAHILTVKTDLHVPGPLLKIVKSWNVTKIRMVLFQQFTYISTSPSALLPTQNNHKEIHKWNTCPFFFFFRT